MLDMTKLLSEVATLKEQDVAGLSEDDLKLYQKNLATMNKNLSEAMAKTSKKEHDYSIDDVRTYIEHILSEAWECRTVPLSVVEDLVDAQKLKRFAPIIAECVQRSEFNEKFTKAFPALSVQRSDIASAKSLLALRSAVRAIVGPLKLARERATYKADYEFMYNNTVDSSDHDAVIKKLISTEDLVEDLRRVNAEILRLFEPTAELKGEELLQAIEDFKREYKCTDTEACKPFNVSRSTLTRLRKERT